MEQGEWRQVGAKDCVASAWEVALDHVLSKIWLGGWAFDLSPLRPETRESRLFIGTGTEIRTRQAYHREGG